MPIKTTRLVEILSESYPSIGVAHACALDPHETVSVMVDMTAEEWRYLSPKIVSEYEGTLPCPE